MVIPGWLGINRHPYENIQIQWSFFVLSVGRCSLVLVVYCIDNTFIPMIDSIVCACCLIILIFLYCNINDSFKKKKEN